MSGQDLTGERFGKLLVLRRADSRNGKTRWLCRCDCGNEKEVAAQALKSGKTKSCGEYNYLDLINEHDGNAWVSSTKGVDVYYPYPEGTSYETAGETVFMILHFKDLHREYGFESGETIEQLIDTCKIEAMQVETTPYGLKFHVPESGFSPFALTWQPKDLASGLDIEGSYNADAGKITDKDEQNGNVQTGDTASLTGWILSAAAAMLFILLLSALKRHRDDELKK